MKVYSLDQNGEEKVHIVYKKYELFPLIWVFKNIQKEVYYQALNSHVILRRSSKDAFINFITSDKEVMLKLINILISILNIYVDRVENLELSKAYPRLILRLLNLANRFGRYEGERVILDVPLTHAEIAGTINMSRETASREFEILKAKGLVDILDHLIVINDLKKLSQELSESYESQRL